MMGSASVTFVATFPGYRSHTSVLLQFTLASVQAYAMHQHI